MHLLFKRHKLPISLPYLAAGTLIFIVVVVVQTASTIDGTPAIHLHRVLIFTINYLVWALIAQHIYSATFYYRPGHHAGSETALLIIHAITWSIVQLVISNVFYIGLTYVYSSEQGYMTLQSFFTIWPRALLSRVVDFIIIFSVLKVIKGYQALSQQRIKLSELEKELSNTKLEMLKAQLNPHFLFNSLHAVTSMIGNDDKRARKMLIMISDLLRKTLDRQTEKFVTLEEELHYMEDYLEIERVRFHDRLDIEYNVGEQTKPMAIPSMLLQPLIENAFKHGISLLEDAGHIKIDSKQIEGKLQITVVNSVSTAGTPESKDGGLGLKNIRNRLNQYFGDAFEFRTSKSTNEFTATVIIPSHAI